MLRITGCFVFCLLLAVGCNESPPAREPPNNGKVKVVAPGVNVDVEPQRDSNSPGKVKVNAPGANVNVGTKPGN